MKYKVVVIDDKTLIRRSLIETVQWDRLDCQVAGEAENGLEAKGLIKKTRPDLIITDIKMPGMDGLELAEYAMQLLPDTKVIIITGYQEFEYAKKALSLGVHNMILKPINNQELEEMVQEALKVMEEQKRQKRAMQYSVTERRRCCLSEIIKGRRRPGEIGREELEMLGLLKKDVSLLYVRTKSGKGDQDARTKTRILEWMTACEQAGGFEILELMSEPVLIMAALGQWGMSARERKIRLKNGLLEINRKLREESGEPCFFVISRTAKNIADLGAYHAEAWEVFNHQYFSSDTELLFVESYTFQTDVHSSSYILQDLDSLYRELAQMDTGTIREQAGELMEQICREVNGDAFRIKCLMSEICITLVRHYRAGIPQEKIADSTNEILEKIDGLPDIRSSREYLIQFMEEMQQYAMQKEGTANPVVAGAVDHIRRHYREEIALTDVAAVTGVNASYLSRLLKKETGRNFSDILTECRITAAKKLLDQPGSRVIDVCEQVGYHDYTYFYQVFKRVEGISPSEYKKKGKKI